MLRYAFTLTKGTRRIAVTLNGQCEADIASTILALHADGWSVMARAMPKDRQIPREYAASSAFIRRS